MALQLIGVASGTNTATIPPHENGDRIFVLAFDTTNTIAPTVPVGWTSPTSGAYTSRWGYFDSDGTKSTTDTWTNATCLVVAVYRDVNKAQTFGSYFDRGTIESTGIPRTQPTLGGFPALGTACKLTAMALSAQNAYANGGMQEMTLHEYRPGGSNEIALYDTNGGITNDLTRQFPPINGTTATYYLISLRIEQDPAAQNTTSTTITAT